MRDRDDSLGRAAGGGCYSAWDGMFYIAFVTKLVTLMYSEHIPLSWMLVPCPRRRQR
jgi:hypothetical protein